MNIIQNFLFFFNYILVDGRRFQKRFIILISVRKGRIFDVLSSLKASPMRSVCLLRMFLRSGHS